MGARERRGKERGKAKKWNRGKGAKRVKIKGVEKEKEWFL